MKSLLLGCLCTLLTMVPAAVIPTEDTLIVTKSDVDPSESTSPAMTEPTSEGPLPAVKLLEMHVQSEVALRYSRTFVTALVKNPAKRSQESTFRVLLPETAFISGFSMTLEGKKYDAYVKEKEEAKQIYTDAVSHGIGAAHIAAKARDSNHFTVTVNVESQSMALFNLTYEELLVRRNGLYHQTINLHPGSLVANLTVAVHVKETQKITTLRVPEITTGNEIAPAEDGAQNTKALIKRFGEDHEVRVTFKPDLEEQKRLMEIYAQKTKESSNSWYSKPEEPESDGVLGQFVVQYDVDRTVGNEVLVNDGYFAHFFAPADLPPLEKHVVFVLDTSGSMVSRKIEQLRQAMQLILGELHKGDYFSIVEFAASVTVHDLKEADQEPEPEKPYYYYYEEQKKPTTLIPPFQATPENIAKAKTIVSRLQADGGTNIAGALDVAVNLVHKGVGWKQTPVPETASKITDGSNDTVSTTDASQEMAKIEINKDDKKLEPMIIFLTDGEPTVGETDPKRIISALSENNYGVRKAAIFSLAFGEDADRKFLRKLSLRNDGFMRHIYEASDAALQLRDFYQQVTSPLLSHVNFTYPPDQVKEESLTKIKFRTYYAGSEVVVAGRIDPTISEISPEVNGFCGVDDGFSRKLYEIRPRITIIKEEKQEYLPLERLWAYLTIKQLLDERDAAEDLDKPKDDKNGREKKALDLALKYSFVTELTSLVVVKPNATKAVNAESVDKSNDAPSYGALQLSTRPSFAAAPAAFSAGVLSVPLYDFSNANSAANYYPESYAYDGLSDIRISADDVSTMFMPAITERETTETLNSLSTYFLEQFPWAQPLLDAGADELVIQVNGTSIHLKLTKDTAGPSSNGDAVPCDRAIDGSSGNCVYLTRCVAAQNITADIFTSTYCHFGNQYAGVCCPKTDNTASTSVTDGVKSEN